MENVDAVSKLTKPSSDSEAVEAKPQLAHTARQMFEARIAKYNDPNNLEWEWEDLAATRWERHAFSAFLDLQTAEKKVASLLATIDQRDAEIESLRAAPSTLFVMGTCCKCNRLTATMKTRVGLLCAKDLHDNFDWVTLTEQDLIDRLPAPLSEDEMKSTVGEEKSPRCFLVEHPLPSGGTWIEVFTQEENARGYANDRETELHVMATVTPLYTRVAQPVDSQPAERASEETIRSLERAIRPQAEALAALWYGDGKATPPRSEASYRAELVDRIAGLGVKIALAAATQPAWQPSLDTGLIPCRHCGEHGSWRMEYGPLPGGGSDPIFWRVECSYCGICTLNHGTKEAAKAVWNNYFPAPSAQPEIEQCSYCREWYSKPVSLHHSDEECDLNVSEHSADAAPCPVCKYHWNQEVYEGQPHNQNCPNFAPTQPVSVEQEEE